MRRVETASGRRSGARTPVKKVPAGGLGMNSLTFAMSSLQFFLESILGCVRHQTGCDMLSRRRSGSFSEALVILQSLKVSVSVRCGENDNNKIKEVNCDNSVMKSTPF